MGAGSGYACRQIGAGPGLLRDDGLSVGVGASSASPPLRLPAGAAAVRGDMHVVGFDATVAKAHGYQVRTSADGRQYSVRIGMAAAVSPDNQVGGNCGFSYVYEYGIG